MTKMVEMKKRYIEQYIEDLCFTNGKIAFVAGPRQAGKTVVSKMLLKKRGVGEYYNWDNLTFRKLWTKDPAAIVPDPMPKTKPLIILDEIHKAKKWKQNLKGVYDTIDHTCDIIVTGSAKLNVYRRGSDSLLGRYFYFRLHPFSLAEISSRKILVAPDDLLNALINKQIQISSTTTKQLNQLDIYGPFPEPLFTATKPFLHLWRRGRVEKIVREDLRDLSRSLELSQIEMLVSLLPERVASPFSLQSLSEDLEVAYTTVKRWMNYLYELYYCFEIKPYTKSLARAIKKEGKVYLWDWSEVADDGRHFENLIAGHLLKYCDFYTDIGEGLFQLSYLKNKEKNEIDFLILKNNKPWLPVEVKLSDTTPSKNWKGFLKQLSIKIGIQVVKQSDVFKLHEINEFTILVVSADVFLSYLV